MKKYIAKRMFVSIVTILIILLLLFCMLQFMPGSPFNDEKLSEAQVQVLNQKYGLDQPIVVQFVNYVKNVVKGDFGVSYRYFQAPEYKTSGKLPDWWSGRCVWSDYRDHAWNCGGIEKRNLD